MWKDISSFLVAKQSRLCLLAWRLIGFYPCIFCTSLSRDPNTKKRWESWDDFSCDAGCPGGSSSVIIYKGYKYPLYLHPETVKIFSKEMKDFVKSIYVDRGFYTVECRLYKKGK